MYVTPNIISMTNREAVDRVVNTLRLTNVDAHISRRYILSLLRNTTAQVISQKLLDRTIGLELNLYSEIPCVEMEKIETIKCPIVEFRRCDIVMKSTKPLPKSIWSRHGSSIKSVTSIDGNFELTISSPQQIKRNRDRQYKLNGEIYAYEDGEGFLWVLDEEIYTVNVLKLTLESELIEDCNKKNNCKSGWDVEFIVPNKIQDTVFKDVINLLGTTYKAIKNDNNPDGNELT